MNRHKKEGKKVAASPRISESIKTSTIMRHVIIALTPALFMSSVYFGVRAVLLTIICVFFCIFFEHLFNQITKKTQTIYDLSAAVTGMIFAFNLPSSFPYWMAIVGCFVAIIIVKQLFGGIRKNILNPAAAAWVVLLFSFPTAMTSWPTVIPIWRSADAITGATPLSLFANGDFAALPSTLSMLLGTIGGSLGETCTVALLLGGLYLIYKKIISWAIPVSFLGTMILVALVVGIDPLFQILAGGAIIGALFMATDYTTSPMTTTGKVIFGIGCGLLAMMFRLYSIYPEGVAFAILIMNLFTPLINKLIIKRENKI